MKFGRMELNVCLVSYYTFGGVGGLEVVRSFIAFDIEDELVLDRLSEVQQKMVDTGADLRVVKPQNIHITIWFFGELPPNRIDRVGIELKNVSFASFDIELRGLGAFPSFKFVRVRPRVVG